MKVLSALIGSIALAATVSGYEIQGWHKQACDGVEEYMVDGSTETGCFNFDEEAGHRVLSVQANFDSDNFVIHIFPEENCKDGSGGTPLESGACYNWNDGSKDQAIYSYKVVKA